MAAANVDQDPDSIVPDTQCNECNELEAPPCENEVVNNSTKSQTDFYIVVSSCILCSNKDNNFMIQCTKCNAWLHCYCRDLKSYQVQMNSTNSRRYTCYQCVEVFKDIHAVCKNVSEIDILKNENDESREQLKTIKDKNKQKETRIALLMKEAEELRDSNKRKALDCNRNK